MNKKEEQLYMTRKYVALCYYAGENQSEECDEVVGLEIRGVQLEGLEKVEILEIDENTNDEKIVHVWKRPIQRTPDDADYGEG